jgi:sulfur-oxidizing protein SoxY
MHACTRWLLILSLALPAVGPVSAGTQEDPLKSVQWDTMKRLFLANHPVTFDGRVRVVAPESAEDSLEVPVFVDASALDEVTEIVVFADLNPSPGILRYSPGRAAPRIGFRFKVQQATPIRAAALTADGVWHVGQTWLEAAGGGCTLPSLGSGAPEWESRLGEVSGRLWARDEGTRLRFSVIHPMDTGLAPGIPQFHIETVDIHDDQGTALARLETFEPISENPVFSLDLDRVAAVRLSGRDNNGNRFDARVTP